MDGNGMAGDVTCSSSAQANSQNPNAAQVVDTFNAASYIPWADLSVVGGAGTFQFAEGAASGTGAGSTNVTTDQTSGPSAADGDQLNDVYTLDLPGNIAPGSYAANLGYAVFSN